MLGFALAKNPVAVMAIMRSLIVGAVIAGCLAGPAYAQKDKPNPLKIDEDLRRKDDEAIDKQYKSTLERTRKDTIETRATDPWSNMRGSDDSKTKR
jgi:hypothetical protein